MTDLLDAKDHFDLRKVWISKLLPKFGWLSNNP